MPQTGNSEFLVLTLRSSHCRIHPAFYHLHGTKFGWKQWAVEESGHSLRCLMSKSHDLTGDCHHKAANTHFSMDLDSTFMYMWILCFWNMHVHYFKGDPLETSRLRVSSCFPLRISYLGRQVSGVTFQIVLYFKGTLVWMPGLVWIPQLSCNGCNGEYTVEGITPSLLLHHPWLKRRHLLYPKRFHWVDSVSEPHASAESIRLNCFLPPRHVFPGECLFPLHCCLSLFGKITFTN